MDMMGAPRPERRHSLDEKHSLRIGIVFPIDITDRLDRRDQSLLGFQNRRDRDKDINDRLGGNAGNCGTSGMLYRDECIGRKHIAQHFFFGRKQIGPARIVTDDFNLVRHDYPAAAFIRRSAAARASAVISAPASMRAISSRRVSAASVATRVVTRRPLSSASLVMSRCWSARAATCGACVTAITWT